MEHADAGSAAAPDVAASKPFDFRRGAARLSTLWRPLLPASHAQLLQFSGDGTHVLAVAADARLRALPVPPTAFWPGGRDADGHAVPPEWEPQVEVAAGEAVYDAAWWPYAAPGGNLLAAVTTREHPVHLWDLEAGSLRATYSAYNHLDEVTAAHSLCFDLGGQRLYGGFARCVRVWDVSRPGRAAEERPTAKTRRARQGQRGLISALAFNPNGSGMYAAGSYACTTALYEERSGDALATLRGQKGGVTHVCFSPCGNYLYTGARKDPSVLCWDLRSTCEVVHSFARVCGTNQRVSFDVDASGSLLATGGADGRVRVYDTGTGEEVRDAFPAFADCASCVAFHPSAVVLAVGTGQRHFGDSDDEDDGQSPVAAGAGTASASKSDGGGDGEGAAARHSFSLWQCRASAEAMATSSHASNAVADVSPSSDAAPADAEHGANVDGEGGGAEIVDASGGTGGSGDGGTEGNDSAPGEAERPKALKRRRPGAARQPRRSKRLAPR